MLIRIVKIHLLTDQISAFKMLFYAAQPEILKFEGCISVELMRNPDHFDQYFTFSKWTDEESLNQYRNSEFFITTWRKTKLLFAEKAIAFSMVNLN